MKPARFEYSAPDTLQSAFEAFTLYGDSAKALAGGQSLIPLLNFRLATPTALVDLNRIRELDSVTITDSSVRVGAITRTARLLHSDISTALPILAEAARHVGHPQIRYRGTVAGSIAHADPAAELPAIAVLLGATIHLESSYGKRDVGADSFFQGFFTTVCGPNELVTAVTFPILESGTGWGFREFGRRSGDFALAGIATLVAIGDGTVSTVKIVAIGVADRPVRAVHAEAALRDRTLDDSAIQDACHAITNDIDPHESVHGTRRYKLHLTSALLEGSLRDAAGRVGG